MANGKLAAAGHRDDLAHEQWLAVAHVSERDHSGKIFMASPINPQDLADKVVTREVVKWDTDDGGIIANTELRIGSIILKSTRIQHPDPEKLVEAISDAITDKGLQLLDWNEKVLQLLNRVQSLKKWNPSQTWPNFSIETLLATNKEWITPYLSGIKKPNELKKIDLKQIIFFVTLIALSIYFTAGFIDLFLLLTGIFWVLYSFYLISNKTLSFLSFNNNYLGFFLVLGLYILFISGFRLRHTLEALIR